MSFRHLIQNLAYKQTRLALKAYLKTSLFPYTTDKAAIKRNLFTKLSPKHLIIFIRIVMIVLLTEPETIRFDWGLKLQQKT